MGKNVKNRGTTRQLERGKLGMSVLLSVQEMQDARELADLLSKPLTVVVRALLAYAHKRAKKERPGWIPSVEEWIAENPKL